MVRSLDDGSAQERCSLNIHECRKSHLRTMREALSQGEAWLGLRFRKNSLTTMRVRIEARGLLRRLPHPGERLWGQWGGKGGAFEKR